MTTTTLWKKLKLILVICNPILKENIMAKQSLDQLLEHISVHGPGMWENDQGPPGWHAVSHGDLSIVAYFAFEQDAYRYRLDLINRLLNELPAEFPAA
jgi:hypothetical protein